MARRSPQESDPKAGERLARRARYFSRLKRQVESRLPTGNDHEPRVHDGAYWVQDIAPPGDGDAAEDSVDAISHVDGYGEPVTEDFRSPGTDPAAHTKRGTRWVAPLSTSAFRNALDVSLSGVDTASIYVEAAGLDPTRPLTLTVESDGPSTLVLKGSFGERAVDVDAGTTEHTLRLCGASHGS